VRKCSIDAEFQAARALVGEAIAAGIGGEEEAGAVADLARSGHGDLRAVRPERRTERL